MRARTGAKVFSDRDTRVTFLFTAICLLFTTQVTAGPVITVYAFQSDQSTVTQTGGFAGIHQTYSVEGQFRLSVDQDAGVAAFVHVDANLIEQSPYLHTTSLNDLFNMTGLSITAVSETSISFEGPADDVTGATVALTLTFTANAVHLTGRTIPPPGSADFYVFELDAVATSPATYYVGATTGNDTNDGQTPATAFATIQHAIDGARDGDTVIVLPGTYTDPGNRDIDFKGKAVTVRSSDPSEPTVVAATIIDCNGTEQEPHRGFYFHSGEDADSIIAGLTVINGVARKGGAVLCSSSSPRFINCAFCGNEAYDDDTGGGGMYNEDCSPTLIDCLFTDNEAMPSASYGGGITNDTSNPRLTKCTFVNNRAWSGGGIYNTKNSSPKLTECIFTGNTAYRGGGMTCNGGNAILSHCSFIDNSVRDYGGGLNNMIASNTTLLNCTFSGNSASSHGGGMLNEDCTPTLLNCTFSGNSAVSDGGGMFNGYNDSAPTLLNCTFSGNDAGGDGGAMYNMYSRPTLTNCIFSRNSARYGGGISVDWCSYSIMTNCIFISNSADVKGGGMNNYDCCFGESTLTNCIFRNNSDGGGMGESAQIYTHEGDGSCNPAINYSCVQKGYPGVGNIDVDPLFVDPCNGDYHLKSQAGRWEPATQVWIIDNVTSPCIDAGDPMSSIGPEPFPNGGVVNMGAHGGTAAASKSWFGGPVCETIVAGDVNGDCVVDFRDMAVITMHWLEGER